MNSDKVKVLSSMLAASAASIIAGCTTAGIDEANREAIDSIKAAGEKIKEGTKSSYSPVTAKMSNEFYIVGKKISKEDRKVLPSFFRETYSFNKVDPVTFSELVSYINKETNLRVDLSPDAIKYILSLQEEEAEEDDSELEFSEDEISELDLAIDGTSIGSDKESVIVGSGVLFSVNFHGTLKSFLDHVLGRVNLSWEWKNNQIEIFHTQQKTFVIDSDFANISFGTASESDDETTQDFSLRAEMGSMYDDIAGVIESSISEYGSYSISRQMSSVTVIDTPSNLKKVERFISSLNESVGKQIMLRVNMFDVTSDENGDYGIDWDAVYGGSTNIASSFTSAPSTPAGSLFSLTSLSGAFSGTSAVVSALSNEENVSSSVNMDFHTTNGRPIKLDRESLNDYIKNTSTTTTESTTVTDVVIDSMETGLGLKILPRIDSSGNIAMTMLLDVSEGEILDKTLPDGTELGLPSKGKRSFVQRAVAKNGQPLLLTGFEREDVTYQGSKIGENTSWLLGGSKSGGKAKTMSVIVITPYVVK